MSNKMASSINEGRDTERGFTAKMSNGKAFFEYSFDIIENDIPSFAKKIIEIAISNITNDTQNIDFFTLPEKASKSVNNNIGYRNILIIL